MSHVLDRPIWSALSGPHAGLAEGDEQARRYPPAIVPFAAMRTPGAADLPALAALPRPGEEMLQVEIDRPLVPPGFETVGELDLVQMVLRRPPPREAFDQRIAPLGDADAAEMLSLAALTKPGPFTLRAQALGPFHGIRIDDRLAAMAGVRMRTTGHWEMSGVCAHPDHRGKGLARALSLFVTAKIVESGDTPYLHAFAGNEAAIRLYESIGYEIRAELKALFMRAP